MLSVGVWLADADGVISPSLACFHDFFTVTVVDSVCPGNRSDRLTFVNCGPPNFCSIQKD